MSYELEIERNGGEWRIRKDPSQRGLNGKPPAKEESAAEAETQGDGVEQKLQNLTIGEQVQEDVAQAPVDDKAQNPAAEVAPQEQSSHEQTAQVDAQDQETQQAGSGDATEEAPADDEDDDSDGWITPANLKKHQAKDTQVSGSSEAIQETLQAALLTSDFAMQNVALRINLKYVHPLTCTMARMIRTYSSHSLVSPSNLSRIKQLKTWVLRCYGCFNVTRQMNKQFCPKCGQATLTRTSSSTDSHGNMRLHLKKNFQYNKRGNVYSVPKPIHGTASGKMNNVQGGGKNHWGKDLILAEDQKEYQKKTAEDRRQRQKDLMDEDYLPNLITGERSGGHGRIRVGAGKNVNSKKRR